MLWRGKAQKETKRVWRQATLINLCIERPQITLKRKPVEIQAAGLLEASTLHPVPSA